MFLFISLLNIHSTDFKRIRVTRARESSVTALGRFIFRNTSEEIEKTQQQQKVLFLSSTDPCADLCKKNQYVCKMKHFKNKRQQFIGMAISFTYN